MTKHVIIVSDAVVAVFENAQPDLAGYTTVADNDARYTSFVSARSVRAKQPFDKLCDLLVDKELITQEELDAALT